MTREEAIKKVRWGLLGLAIDKDVRDAFETLIPELRESEDEMIRKWLYDYISNCPNNNFAFYGGVGKDAVLNYLEKQKESLHISETCKENADSFTEEVKRYYSDNFEYLSSDQPTLSILTNIARHFAQWQKERMMKDALEGEAEELYNDGGSQCTVGVGTYFKPGEKVYVLKAEEE